MKQLVQKLRDGSVTVEEFCTPLVGKGMVLVRNHYSVISSGTEGATAKTARKSLLGKALERPQQAKQVLDMLGRQGLAQTYRAVAKRLEAYSPLGYTCAGVVMETGDSIAGFSPGDKVACAGVGYACHAEVVAVPLNLCVKLAPDTDLRQAAYNSLGAIALQGIRQADLRLGETCAVIGLGLIGQLTCLLLRAGGVKVIGIDVDNYRVSVAKDRSADIALLRSAPGAEESILGHAGGAGVDAVIITAGTASLDPINFAGTISRKKGRVVVVGAIPTGFDRDPHYYRKELELKMACSYGPGRYDPGYEEKGLDYPRAYVRWTEKRNMEAFQDLLHGRRLDLGFLTTHEFALEEAPQAYDLILQHKDPVLGIVIRYDIRDERPPTKIQMAGKRAGARVSLAFIGAGSYAQSHLLPNLPRKSPDIVFKGVMTASGSTSKRVAEQYGFEFCTSDPQDIVSNDQVNTVFIATRHDSHAKFVEQALAGGKNVFVEKPLAIKPEELAAIVSAYEGWRQARTTPPVLMVGFNRRFSPLAVRLKEAMAGGPLAMIYRINAGAVPRDSWVQDPEVGGGRIIGEVCHFIDLMTYFAGALPRRVYASAVPDPQSNRDTVAINLEFEDGSIGAIAYFSSGAKSIDKEYIEVYRGGATGIIRDFRTLEIHGGRKVLTKKLLVQDKGQAAMMKAFIQAIVTGTPSPIGFEELVSVTRATFSALGSLSSAASVII